MIKNKQARKTIAVFFLLNFLSTLMPYNALYANNNGPNAPEASGFEPVNATDMVNLSSGDMAYVLPLLEVDGFPVTLSYHAGIPMDMDASWVGLGWNINTGSIARGVVSTPDDWNKGKSMKFTYYYYETDSYSVDVGVGFGKAASVGVGLSWGSNKSLSGSVSASVGPISASMDTNGNYSVGVNANVIGEKLGFKDAFAKPGDSGSGGFGGSLSISGNTNGGGISVGANAGYSKNGLSVGMGVSISSNGFGAGYSIGAGSDNTGTNKMAAGAGGSIGSFSAGDLSISTSGFYLPISIGIFSFGFGYQKQKISYKKGLNRYGFGSLYQSSSQLDKEDLYESVYENGGGSSERNDNSNYSDVFNDLQRRNYYGDTYDQEIPQVEIDFTSDYRNPIEKLNFTFAGYDTYGVNASGISGNLSPIVGENTALIGEGFEGENSKNENFSQRVCYTVQNSVWPYNPIEVCSDVNVPLNKMKVFYHNSLARNRRTGEFYPQLGTRKSLNNNNFYFSFDGQITESINITGSIKNSSYTSGLNLSDFVDKNSSYTSRPKMGSYVEVFTNKQLDTNPSLMLQPKSVYNNNTRLSRESNLGYVGDGIGGYKITAPDGKTYHFAQPVYQYESIEHNYIEIDKVLNTSGLNSTSKRSATPYATHWLLTAITGPDYIDNGNNYPDENDLGYWLRLDHGHWSNAYAWRTPYADTTVSNANGSNSITVSKEYRQYSTYNENDVDKADAGHFMQGRKDIYYLDKIVSRNQIAYFVKDLRKDGVGTDLDYIFTNDVNGSLYNDVRKAYEATPFFKEFLKKSLNELSIANSNSTLNNESIYGEEEAYYEKEYLLKLDKIIITKNTESSRVLEATGNSLGGITANTPTSKRYRNLGFFDQFLSSASKVHKLHQVDNVIDVNDFVNYDYSKALKVIKFTYDYELAKSTPNTTHSNKNLEGKLTLKKVQNYGRGLVSGATENQLYDYMPPFKFLYKGANVKYHSGVKPSEVGETMNIYGNTRDAWGFIEGKEGENTLADSWSLNRIETPQGSTIDIEYEEDDFYVEAFSRRYWQENLKFQVIKTVDSPVDEFEIRVEYDDGYTPREEDKFTHYFQQNDRVFLDLWIGVTSGVNFSGCDRRGKIDLTPREDGLEIKSISETSIVLKAKGNEINDCRNCTPGGDYDCCKQDLVYVYREGPFEPYKLAWWAKRNISMSAYDANQPRNSCPGNQAGTNHAHSMKYKLLAAKSPTGRSGGGLKVAKITVNGEGGAKYETSYNYNVPVNESGAALSGKSSGITSFYPVQGTKFIPYQNELPGPGVMYEWVTMEAKGYNASGQALPTEKTRYHFYTLQPNFHIFDPNFTMKDNDGEVLFKATVNNKNVSQANLTAKDITIEKNLAKIGQLISVEKFNTEGQLINKTLNSYTNKQASFKETFSSMKSVYTYNYPNEGDNQYKYLYRQLKGRLLSLSSKIEYGKVLNKVTTTTPYGESSIEYSDPDQYLGTYRTAIKTMADGSKLKETKIPAYEVYSEMGSKISNPTNRNMLTQEAMNISSVAIGEGDLSIWRTTNAAVTTWKNDWIYRDENGVETTPQNDVEKIWRKHKTFVWKGTLDEYGAYGRGIGKNDFVWTPDAVQTNNEWQNISEITRYTHYSLPVETKDINDNYASSKMADNFSKVIAGGNAKYTEMYYSGLEYANADNLTKSEDEFTFEGCTLSNNSHTGKKSVIISDVSKAFKINKNTSDIRPGSYKASLWTNKRFTGNDCLNAPAGQPCDQLPPDYPIIVLNGDQIRPVSTVKAGNWYQYNFIIDVVSPINLYVTNQGLSRKGNETLVDDFRIHPIASSMNAYVYDQATDELKYILDANNLATEFKYDKAGRLCRTYKEVADQGANQGGFKLVKEYKYNYKNGATNSGDCNCCDN